MRTSINLPDPLARAVKERAAALGRTFTSLVEEGLRLLLAQEEAPDNGEALPTYGDPKKRFLVDIADRDALWQALDADGPR
jgi:hypothetical protein